MNQNANESQDGGATRREFLKKSALAAAAVGSASLFKTPVYGQNTAPSANVTGANNRLLVGYIGVGNQGQFHVQNQKANAAANNIEQIALCDLSKTRQQQAGSIIGGNVKVFDDYQKMLELKELDAVTIATCDHWHCKTTLAALDAGKHVYCEKPMTRYLPEAFQVYDKVKATGKIFQVGAQGCSAAAWHQAADMISKDQIGKVVWAQGYYCRNSKNGEWNLPVPQWISAQDLNWDKWQEPVNKKQPLNPEAYIRWRKYYPYCAGLLGDLVPHRLVPLMLATGNPEYPTRVTSIGTKPVDADKTPPGAPERDAPEQVQILAEFPSGMTLLVVTSTVNARSPGFAIYGHKASLEIGSSGERIQLIPEKDWSEDIDLQNFDGLTPTESVPEHEKNWFNCIRDNKAPNGNIDLSIRAQVVISLAEMSNRMNMMCLWDEKERKIKSQDGKEISAITYGTIEPS
ncbi:MAG TPA: Gfo/Idh/MocA family oxidoreductase [Verrucomicrobiae bacterium]|jgi:predicted dehydrogenase